MISPLSSKKARTLLWLEGVGRDQFEPWHGGGEWWRRKKFPPTTPVLLKIEHSLKYYTRLAAAGCFLCSTGANWWLVPQLISSY